MIVIDHVRLTIFEFNSMHGDNSLGPRDLKMGLWLKKF
jgi:hypothetical protein